MSFQFTLTPRNPHDEKFQNADFKNKFIDKVCTILHGWEPVRMFPKDKEISFDHHLNGAITFNLNFLSFTWEDDIAPRVVMKMLKESGLDSLYFLSQAQIGAEKQLIGINGSLEKGYGYPSEYFPELQLDNSPEPTSKMVH